MSFVQVQSRKRNNYFGKRPVIFSGRNVIIAVIDKLGSNEIEGQCFMGGRSIFLWETFDNEEERNERYKELQEEIRKNEQRL